MNRGATIAFRHGFFQVKIDLTLFYAAVMIILYATLKNRME